MTLADSYLYYPFIQIPDSTLIHSLLFKNSIKRIIPAYHDMDRNVADEAYKQNEVCRQYLGYDFIDEADYWEARETIAPIFCDFLDEISATKYPEVYSPILGENYQSNFNIKNKSVVFGTKYIVYARKLSGLVFSKLDELGWMKFHEDSNACEMSQELSNLYMTLLAACISQQSKEPISTSSKLSDDIINSKIFRSSFKTVLPQYSDNNDAIQRVCINLLLNKAEPKQPIETILSFPEAVRIRAGLEKERQEFCNLVDDLTNKVELLDLKDPEAFLSLEVKDVIEVASQYINQIQSEAKQQIASERKDMISNIQTGLSLTLPVIGLLGEVYLNNAPYPGLWGTSFAALGLTTYFLPDLLKSNDEQQKKIAIQRENAYLYMNKLWNIQDVK